MLLWFLLYPVVEYTGLMWDLCKFISVADFSNWNKWRLRFSIRPDKKKEFVHHNWLFPNVFSEKIFIIKDYSNLQPHISWIHRKLCSIEEKLHFTCMQKLLWETKDTLRKKQWPNLLKYEPITKELYWKYTFPIYALWLNHILQEVQEIWTVFVISENSNLQCKVIGI